MVGSIELDDEEQWYQDSCNSELSTKLACESALLGIVAPAYRALVGAKTAEKIADEIDKLFVIDFQFENKFWRRGIPQEQRIPRIAKLITPFFGEAPITKKQ